MTGGLTPRSLASPACVYDWSSLECRVASTVKSVIIFSMELSYATCLVEKAMSCTHDENVTMTQRDSKKISS